MKKSIAILIAVMMIFTMMPTTVMASTAVGVSTEQELRDAIANANGTKDNPTVIQVKNDITITETVKFEDKFVVIEGKTSDTAIKLLEVTNSSTAAVMFRIGGDKGTLEEPAGGIALKSITLDLNKNGRGIYAQKSYVELQTGATIKNGNYTKDGGAAVYLGKDATMNMRAGSKLLDNTSGGKGGAICIWASGDARPTAILNIYGGVIENSYAGNTGAIWNSTGEVNIYGGTFKGNSTNTWGSVGYANSTLGCLKSADMNNPIIFDGNSSDWVTVALNLCFPNTRTTPFVIDGVIFKNNSTASYGTYKTIPLIGPVGSSVCPIVVKNCYFENNECTDIVVLNTVTLSDNTFADNLELYYNAGSDSKVILTDPIGAEESVIVRLEKSDVSMQNKILFEGTDDYQLSADEIKLVNVDSTVYGAYLDVESNTIKARYAAMNGGNFANSTDCSDTQFGTPMREGYEFAGWYSDPNFETLVENPVVGDTLYYAKWTYDINFDGNGADGGDTDAMEDVVDGDTVTQLAASGFSKTGYTFESWNTKPDGSGDSYLAGTTDKPSGDTTLYAQWTPNTYTINFNANGATGTTTSVAATYDQSVALTENGFAKADSNFAGWAVSDEAAYAGTVAYADKSSVVNLTATSGASVTLYAVWTDKDVIPTFANGAQEFTYDRNVYEYELDGLTELTGFTVSYYVGDDELANPSQAGIYNVVITRPADTTYAAFSQTIPNGLVIEKVDLKIKANNQSIYAGGEAADLTSPVLGTHYTITGLVEGDGLVEAVAMEYQQGGVAVDPSAVGTYEIIITAGDGGSNYNTTWTNGTLTISNRPSSRPSSKPAATVTTPEAVTTPDAVEVSSFSDVASDAYYAEATEYVLEKGLMNGIGTDANGNKQFGGNMPTNRAMIVTILYRLEGSPAVTGGTSFSDINGTEYYADAVSWAVANGIVNGYGDIYAPLDELTREQLATILWRYAAYKGYDVTAIAELGGFVDDHMISEYAEEALSWANAVGLINGVGNDTLDPQGDAIRAHLAIMLMRFCEDIAK